MVIVIILALLFGAFFVLRRNIGPSLLAMIAGLSVYNMFGTDVVDLVVRNTDNLSGELIGHIVYLILVLALPLLLYFRSNKGGLFGIFRIGEAIVYASLLVSLCSGALSYFLGFDSLSLQILDAINSVKGPILMIGIATAYLDVLLYHD